MKHLRNTNTKFQYKFSKMNLWTGADPIIVVDIVGP